MSIDPSTVLRVDLDARGYDITIAEGPVVDPMAHADLWRGLLVDGLRARDVALVTNTTLAPLYGHALEAALKHAGLKVVTIVVADGEEFKTQAMLDAIHDAMLEARLDRQAVVVALGGGVVGDVAGFAAATYQRGVRFVQVPTTLLSQVDSSVGGKTGINHRLGKNMIGAFHQPSAVVIDPATLKSLPPREYSAGLAEVIKYGVALDRPFFDWLERNIAALMAHDASALAQAIRRSCEIKARIVGNDERESGERALLNFGHTFGHAIEGATGYGTWLHGEAVAAGMMMASRLSQRLGAIDAPTLARVRRLLDTAALPVDEPAFDDATWISWMAGDKKAEAGRIRFVVLSSLGASRLTTVDDASLKAVLHEGRGAQAEVLETAVR